MRKIKIQEGVIKMGIGDKLQQIITARNTNVNELAIRAKVSPNTLYSIIKRNNTKADIDILIRISRVLGVTVEYFSDEADANQYYLDSETAMLAQELKDNPQYRVLLDSTKKLKPESIKEVMKFIDYQIAKEKGELDE